MTENTRIHIKRGSSREKDENRAVVDLLQQIEQPDAAGVVFFCSSKYDLDRLGKALSESFDCPLIGCTTAGEIAADGYSEHSLVGVSLKSAELKMHQQLITPLTEFNLPEAERTAYSLEQQLVLFDKLNRDNMFGLLLIDGMSMLEEQAISSLHSSMGGMQIIGGSAGDDLQFNKTWVYADGSFVSDAAVFTLIETTLPFATFKTQHFEPSDTRLVVTEADPSHRVVTEINGNQAVYEYAKAVGVETSELTPTVFSKHPVMLKIGGEYYVRSIQKVNEDGSLSFYCAIDTGLVLTVANGIDLVRNLKDQLDEVRSAVPNIKLIIGCDCILRRLEIFEKGIVDDVQCVLADYNFIGFSTYGEQYNSIHVNQTITGVAMGG